MADVAGNPVLGFVVPWAPNFAPRGWAFCQGQLLLIAQHDALFSLLGTQFGGDGRTTFGLPDLRGRVAVGVGQGAGLSNYNEGTKAGSEQVTLNAQQIPAHTHPNATEPQLQIVATTDEGNVEVPGATDRLAAGKLSTGQDVNLYSDVAADTELGGLQTTGGLATAQAGGGQSHENRQPYQVLHYIICLQGIYPSRS